MTEIIKQPTFVITGEIFLQGVAREKSPHFRIVDRYPAGESGTSPVLVLKPREHNNRKKVPCVWKFPEWAKLIFNIFWELFWYFIILIFS